MSEKNITQDKIGLIGIGLVGSALAENLIKGNFRVIGYDLDKEKMNNFEKMGGIPVKSSTEVADKCSTILLSLMTTDIVNEVINGDNGILKASINPHTIIDTTTGDPIKAVIIADDLKKIGINYLDATISGSSVQIKNRDGVFMVGGDEKTFKSNIALFDALAKKSLYVGSSGKGTRAKLAVNLIVGLNRLVLAEGFHFAELMGLDLEKTLEIFKETQAYSRIIDAKGEKMINNDFTTQSRISQHRKDVSLILKMAESKKKNLPLSNLHIKVLDRMIERGEGDLDTSAVIEEIRKIADETK